MEMNIDYHNTDKWVGVYGDSRVDYTVSVSMISGAKSKIKEEIFSRYEVMRVGSGEHVERAVGVRAREIGSVGYTRACS